MNRKGIWPRITCPLTSLVLGLSMGAVMAQEWEWVGTARDDRANAGLGLSVDVDGELIVAGNFTGQVGFGTNFLGGNQKLGAFLVKYASEGPVAWAAQVLSTNDIHGTAVTMDGEYAVYLAGTFSGVADFGQVKLTSSGAADIFLARYDHDGNLIWAKQAGGNGIDAATSIALDVEANVYITGYFAGTATFGTNTLTSAGNSDMFVAKYDPNGNLVWVRQGGGSGDAAGDKGLGIALDQQNNAYVVGVFTAPIAQFGQKNLTSNGGSDIFLVKYDGDGNVLWAQKAGGSGDDSGNSVALDVYNDIYLTGSFSGTAAFGTNSVTSLGGSDIFLAKYDDQGNALWVKRAGGPAGDAGTSVAVDLQGNPYIAGYFNSGSSSTGTAAFDSLSLTSNGDSDLFAAKFDSTGKVLWAKSAGGTKPDAAQAIALTAEGDCYLTGYYTSPSVAFGDTIITSTTTDKHYFLAKLESGEPAVGPIILSFPTALTNQVGQAITLSVTAIVSEFSSFQWRFNGTNLVDGGRISGATTPSLTIGNVQPSDAGKYSLVVVDLDGSVTSQEAVLNVIQGPGGPTVSIGMYAGLLINGKAGQTYTIKFTTDVSGATRWTNLTTITLTNDVQFFLDNDSASQKARRYYLVEP